MPHLIQYFKRHSENIAGCISLLGSSLFLLTGYSYDIIAVIIFTMAELTLARAGHKKLGYSIGATLFCLGDILLALSPTIEHGSALQFTLFSMAAAWALGALLYPLKLIADKYHITKLSTLAGTLPAICGSINLVLRLPAIVSATLNDNYITALAITAWAIADILAGRLQERVSQFYGFLKHRK